MYSNLINDLDKSCKLIDVQTSHAAADLYKMIAWCLCACSYEQIDLWMTTSEDEVCLPIRQNFICVKSFLKTAGEAHSSLAKLGSFSWWEVMFKLRWCFLQLLSKFSSALFCFVCFLFLLPKCKLMDDLGLVAPWFFFHSGKQETNTA